MVLKFLHRWVYLYNYLLFSQAPKSINTESEHEQRELLYFSVCSSMSYSNCCFLTCIQISKEASQVVWYSHLFQNFPQFIGIHTVKGFGIVNKAKIDVFLELSCFFDDLEDVGILISGSSAFSKTSLNIWKFTVHVLLKPGLENSEHYFTSVWDQWNCVVVWAFFGIAFLWGLNENWPFPVLWPLLSFTQLNKKLSFPTSPRQ